MDYLPEIEDLISYVESLKIQVKDEKVNNEELKKVILNLPSSIKIKNDMSQEELVIVFDVIRWAWKEITKKDLNDLEDVSDKPETLMGNYWLLKNGLLLHGTNHYTMIKQNPNIFCTLFKIGGMSLQEKLAGPPERVIKLIIDKGGMRVFVTEDKRAFFQMNDKTYAEWGRKKVKKLDFNDKIVKLIDKKCNYSGWNSGITILL